MSVNKEFNFLVVANTKGYQEIFMGVPIVQLHAKFECNRFLALESLKLYPSTLTLFLQIMSLTLYCRKSKI